MSSATDSAGVRIHLGIKGVPDEGSRDSSAAVRTLCRKDDRSKARKTLSKTMTKTAMMCALLALLVVAMQFHQTEGGYR